MRRRTVEHEYAVRNATREHPAEAGDLRPVIDEQVNALPEKYRLPLVLCGVQGLGKHEIAEQLGVPEGTVLSRLARGREMLRDRLARRGVVVPTVALLTAAPLSAGTPAAVAEVAVGVSPIRPEVLFLSQEVLKTMTLAKWKLLSAIAVAVAVSGGGIGLYAARADDKKTPPNQDVKKPPVEEVKKVKPATADDPTKPKPEKVKPDGEKPKPAGIKVGGEISALNAAAKTITVLGKTEKGPVEKAVKLTDDAKVFVDGKESTLAAVKKGAFAQFAGAAATKDGQPPTATEVRVTGRTLNGLVTDANANSVTIETGSKDSKEAHVLKLAANGRVQYGKTADAKLSDVQVGDKVIAVLTTDGASALLIQGGSKGDEKPKPKKPGGE